MCRLIVLTACVHSNQRGHQFNFISTRSALTVAISRARAEPEKSIEMIKLLINDLNADVNQSLLWKNPETAGSKVKVIPPTNRCFTFLGKFTQVGMVGTFSNIAILVMLFTFECTFANDNQIKICSKFLDLNPLLTYFKEHLN